MLKLLLKKYLFRLTITGLACIGALVVFAALFKALVTTAPVSRVAPPAKTESLVMPVVDHKEADALPAELEQPPLTYLVTLSALIANDTLETDIQVAAQSCDPSKQVNTLVASAALPEDDSLQRSISWCLSVYPGTALPTPHQVGGDWADSREEAVGADASVTETNFLDAKGVSRGLRAAAARLCDEVSCTGALTLEHTLGDSAPFVVLRQSGKTPERLTLR